MLKSIVSLFSSSNKLGNNFSYDANLLMSVSSLLISNKNSTIYCNWLDTNNNFWCRHELKIWISDALFGQKRFWDFHSRMLFFWTIRVYENRLKRSFHKSQFQNPQNLDGKTDCFTIHEETTSNSRWNKNKYIFAPTDRGALLKIPMKDCLKIKMIRDYIN